MWVKTKLEINDEMEIFYEVVRWISCHDASVDKDIVLDIMRLAEFLVSRISWTIASALWRLRPGRVAHLR